MSSTRCRCGQSRRDHDLLNLLSLGLFGRVLDAVLAAALGPSSFPPPRITETCFAPSFPTLPAPLPPPAAAAASPALRPPWSPPCRLLPRCSAVPPRSASPQRSPPPSPPPSPPCELSRARAAQLALQLGAALLRQRASHVVRRRRAARFKRIFERQTAHQRFARFGVRGLAAALEPVGLGKVVARRRHLAAAGACVSGILSGGGLLRLMGSTGDGHILVLF